MSSSGNNLRSEPPGFRLVLDTMINIVNTMINLLNTKINLLNNMINLLDTMINIVNTMINFFTHHHVQHSRHHVHHLHCLVLLDLMQPPRNIRLIKQNPPMSNIVLHFAKTPQPFRLVVGFWEI